MNPMQYAVYKGTGGRFGAVQFNFQPPHFFNGKEKDFDGVNCFEVVEGKRKLKEGWAAREGCVFVDIAPTVEKNVYDWKQKIIMALSVGDLGKLLYFLTTGKSSNSKEREKDGKPSNSMTIMHDPNAQGEKAGTIQKYLRIFSPNGTAEGCMFSVAQKKGEERLEHSVPISGDELMVLRALVQRACSSALNW